MNHIYRIVWNHATACYQAVTESAKGQGKHSGKSTTVVHGGHPDGSSNPTSFLTATAIAAALCIVSHNSFAGPAGGQVTAGNATITQTGAPGNTATTINQSSNRAAIDWSKFSVGANESVRFNQPGRNSVTLNRVTGTEASAIMGKLSANGQVFILNPNGVLFGAGSEVNVGSLVASTMRLDNANFMAGNYKFTGDNTGSVINNGSITVAPGGTLALMAPVVQNTGTLNAPNGSVLLAGAQAVTLSLETDGGLISYTLDQGSVQALVDNGGLIQANGGHVVLTAKGVDALSKAVVNHSGVIEAQTVDGKSGVIELLADMQSGTVNVSGKLDASAPNGGDGGFIETSAAKVKIDPSATITTIAHYGKIGTFLIDPTDYIIADTGGDMTPQQIIETLWSTNVTIETGDTGTQSGNIFVNSYFDMLSSPNLAGFGAALPSRPYQNTTLHLKAHNNIFLNAKMSMLQTNIILTPDKNNNTGGKIIVNPAFEFAYDNPIWTRASVPVGGAKTYINTIIWSENSGTIAFDQTKLKGWTVSGHNFDNFGQRLTQIRPAAPTPDPAEAARLAALEAEQRRLAAEIQALRDAEAARLAKIEADKIIAERDRVQREIDRQAASLIPILKPVGEILNNEVVKVVTTGIDNADTIIDIPMRLVSDPLKMYDQLKIDKVTNILGDVGKVVQIAESALVLHDILSDAASGQLNVGSASDVLVNIAGYTPASLLFMPAQLATLAVDVLNEGSVAATLATTIENAQKTQTGFLTRMDNLATSIAKGQISVSDAQVTFARDVSQLKSELEGLSDLYRGWNGGVVSGVLVMTGNGSNLIKFGKAVEDSLSAISNFDFFQVRVAASAKVLVGN